MLNAACEIAPYCGAGLCLTIGIVVLGLILFLELRARRRRRIAERERRDWCVQHGFDFDDGVVGDGAWPPTKGRETTS